MKLQYGMPLQMTAVKISTWNELGVWWAIFAGHLKLQSSIKPWTEIMGFNRYFYSIVQSSHATLKFFQDIHQNLKMQELQCLGGYLVYQLHFCISIWNSFILGSNMTYIWFEGRRWQNSKKTLITPRYQNKVFFSLFHVITEELKWPGLLSILTYKSFHV